MTLFTLAEEKTKFYQDSKKFNYLPPSEPKNPRNEKKGTVVQVQSSTAKTQPCSKEYRACVNALTYFLKNRDIMAMKDSEKPIISKAKKSEKKIVSSLPPPSITKSEKTSTSSDKPKKPIKVQKIERNVVQRISATKKTFFTLSNYTDNPETNVCSECKKLPPRPSKTPKISLPKTDYQWNRPSSVKSDPLVSSIENKLRDLNIRKRKINQLINREIKSMGWESVKTDKQKCRVDTISDFPRFEDFMSKLEETYKLQDFVKNVDEGGNSNFDEIQEMLDKNSIFDDHREKMSNSSDIPSPSTVNSKKISKSISNSSIYQDEYRHDFDSNSVSSQSPSIESARSKNSVDTDGRSCVEDSHNCSTSTEDLRKKFFSSSFMAPGVASSRFLKKYMELNCSI